MQPTPATAATDRPEPVVLLALGGVGQDVVGLLQQRELLRVAGFRVVGMKARREKFIHALNRSRLSVGADLQELVIIRLLQKNLPGENASLSLR